MQALDRFGKALNQSNGARLGVLLAVFVPSLVPLWLVGSGRVDGAAPIASLLAVGWVVWALVVIGLTQWWRGLGWREIGLRRPPSWARALLQALAIAGVAMLVAKLTEWLVIQPTIGEEADISRFDNVRGNPLTLVRTILTVWITSAFPEEVIWRGFLMTRLAEILGGSRSAWISALVASSALFGVAHLYQGAAGVIVVGVIGVVFGLAFLWVRNLWPLVVAHGLMHLISFHRHVPGHGLSPGGLSSGSASAGPRSREAHFRGRDSSSDFIWNKHSPRLVHDRNASSRQPPAGSDTAAAGGARNGHSPRPRSPPNPHRRSRKERQLRLLQR